MNFFIKYLVKTIGFLTSKLPRNFLRWTGSWLGFLWYDLFKFRRKIVMDNLAIAFPEWTEQERHRVGRESVYNLGYNATEIFTIPFLNKKWLEKNCVYEGWEHVQQARALGKGMLFLTLHLGNGDIGASTIAMTGLEVHLITKTFKTKWFNDMWFSVRGAQGVRYIDAHGPNNAFEILKALKKNSAVVFVLDQYMGKPFGISSKFFGKVTGTAYGLALFVQKTKAPVLPIYTYEGPDNKVHMVFEPIMDLQKCLVEDKEITISNLTQTFNEKLEEIIRKHPEQWMWVHRRWKEFK